MIRFCLICKIVAVFFLSLGASVALDAQYSASPIEPAPAIFRENIEWLDIWVPDADGTNLPRVLLIGDSITRAYYPDVENDLKGRASVARLATSKCAGDPVLLEEVSLVLNQYHFDIIHFNNGMHGPRYSDASYGAGIEQLIALLKKEAPGAKLILANTTPVRDKSNLNQLAPRTEQVQARNRIADALAAKAGIPVNDLYTLVLNHPEYAKPDGVHFNEAGAAVEATQVAGQISTFLKEPSIPAQ